LFYHLSLLIIFYREIWGRLTNKFYFFFSLTRLIPTLNRKFIGSPGVYRHSFVEDMKDVEEMKDPKAA
jgi:hypothetical protein